MIFITTFLASKHIESTEYVIRLALEAIVSQGVLYIINSDSLRNSNLIDS